MQKFRDATKNFHDCMSWHVFPVLRCRILCYTLAHGRKAPPRRSPACRCRYLPTLAFPGRGSWALFANRLDDDSSMGTGACALPLGSPGGSGEPVGEAGAAIGL